MIELFFDESGAASMKISRGEGFQFDAERARIFVGGDGTVHTSEYCFASAGSGEASEIVLIPLMGDVGDISGLPDLEARMEILRAMRDFHGDPRMKTEEWLEQGRERAEASVLRFMKAVREGEAVRIWWSDAPHETCGYYWALSVLEKASCPVGAIKLPRLWLPLKNGKETGIAFEATGELSPNDFHALLPLERGIGCDERKAVASEWNLLVSENAPLRAVLNGALRSVPEDFYDYALRNAYTALSKTNFTAIEAIRSALKEGLRPDDCQLREALSSLAREEFGLLELAGHAFSRWPGAYLWWYGLRLRQWIARGELEVVKEDERFFHTTVRIRKTLDICAPRGSFDWS